MIRAGEPNDYAAEILFELPLASNPLVPKTAHVFVLGEVQIKLPSAAWVSVALDHIVERGEGWYAIRLTAGQRAAEAVVAYDATCAGAQPDRGTEIVGGLSGDIAEGEEGVIPFYLPDELNPLYAPPLEGHIFLPGEVQLSLPDDAFGDVDPADIVELGGGMYGVQLDATQTTKRGKAIVVANVPGAQRFSGARTILGEGALVTPVPPPLPPSSPGTEDSTAVAGDILLTWSNATGDADISLITADASGDPADIATDRGLATAVLLSLFTDRRAEDDDVPPSGDPTDRRGWWADHFSAVEGDRMGSRLWLLDRSKRTNETVLRAKEYVREALAWMIEDKVTSSVEVDVEATKAGLLISVGLQRPGRDRVSFRFAHVWQAIAAPPPAALPPPPPPGRLVVVAGQSVALGQGDTDHCDNGFDLATPFAVPFDTQYSLAPLDPPTWAYNSNTTLRPYNSNAGGKNFGPELTLGRELYAAGFNPVIGKMAINQSGLQDHWLPTAAYPSVGPNLFSQFVAYVHSLQTLYGTTLASIVWVQGEHDASDSAQAAAYAANLTTFMAAVRAEFGASVTIIVAKLIAASAETYNATLRAQQVAYVAGDPLSKLVANDDLPLPDTVHPDGDGTIALGQRLAFGLLDLHGYPRAAIATANPQAIGWDATAFGAGALAPRSWAGQVDGDREYLVVATALASAAHTLSDAQGFTAVGAQVESLSAGVYVRVSVWERAVVAGSMVDGRMPSPTVADANGYNIAQIYTVRGPTTGPTTNASTGTAANAFGTALTLASPATGVVNCLVMHFVAALSGSNVNSVTVTNGGLTGVGEKRDTITLVTDNYPMLSLTTGVKAAIGATGSAAVATSGNVYSLCGLTVAVQP